VDAPAIDRINILAAIRVAMGRALAEHAIEPELVLTDFVELAAVAWPQAKPGRG
jgi:hypothetical protein